MVGIIYLPMSLEIMDVKKIIEKYIVNSQKEKDLVIGKSKAPAGFFKGVVEGITEVEVRVAVGKVIEIPH